MTWKSPWFGLAMALASQVGHAIPVVTGDGIEPLGATGSFGSMGNIFEYRLQGTPDLAFTSSQTMVGVDGLRLDYTFTASSTMALTSAAIFLDADIKRFTNGWFEERGEAMVAAGGATSWEIDEPGFGVSYVGDIYGNYLNGAYDNSVFDGQADLAEDVAMGLAFDFGNLGAGDQLLLQIMISESLIGPGWGTQLHQWDEEDGLAGDNLYLAGRFTIQRVPPVDPPTPGVIPEPETFALLALGLLGLASARRRFI